MAPAALVAAHPASSHRLQTVRHERAQYWWLAEHEGPVSSWVSVGWQPGAGVCLKEGDRAYLLLSG